MKFADAKLRFGPELLNGLVLSHRRSAVFLILIALFVTLDA